MVSIPCLFSVTRFENLAVVLRKLDYRQPKSNINQGIEQTHVGKVTLANIRHIIAVCF